MSNASFFSTLKIVDLTGELGPYAGRMFSGLGADVVHVEPLAGNPLRRTGPFYRNTPGRDASLPFLYFNAGKRGLAVDLESEGGQEVLRRLCAKADLLIESCDVGYLNRLGLSYDALSAMNPRLVQTSITHFGQTGPMSTVPGCELTTAALSGFLYLAGIDNDKPVRAPDNQTYRMAEAYAAVGSAIALFNARRTGEGQFVDVPCIEAGAMALENAAQFWDLEGKIRRGHGRQAGGGTIHPCTDGHIVIVAIMGSNKVMWDPFVEWMRQEGIEEWREFDDPKWLDSAYRYSAEGYATFCRIFEAYTRKHSKLYLYETGQKYKVSVTPITNGKDLLENAQLQHRGFWQTVYNDALGGDVTYPGGPYEFGELRWRFGRNAPRLGEHTREILSELEYSQMEIEALATKGAIYAEHG